MNVSDENYDENPKIQPNQIWLKFNEWQTFYLSNFGIIKTIKSVNSDYAEIFRSSQDLGNENIYPPYADILSLQTEPIWKTVSHFGIPFWAYILTKKFDWSHLRKKIGGRGSGPSVTNVTLLGFIFFNPSLREVQKY